MVPRGLEPRTLRLLAVRSNQLSYETLRSQPLNNVRNVSRGRFGLIAGTDDRRARGTPESQSGREFGAHKRQKRKAANAGRGVCAGAVRVLSADVAACAPTAAARNKHRSPQTPSEATGCTPMRRSAVEGRSRPHAATADTHTPLGAARCGEHNRKCRSTAHAARARGLAQNEKVSRGFEPRSLDSGSRVLTVTP